MAAGAGRRYAPRLIRWIGWYYIALSVLSVSSAIAASNMPLLRWYQIIGFPLTLAAGVGLVLEQRWAYLAAVVFGGLNFTVTVLALLLVVLNPSHVSLVLGMLFALMNLAVVAPPLLLLGPKGRAWFQMREAAGTAAV